MDPAVVAALDQLRADNAALQAQLAELIAAAPAAAAPPPAHVVGLTAADIEAAVAAAMPPAIPHNHSRDLEKFPEFSGEETGEAALPPKDFLKNLRWIFDTKNTPANLQVSLSVLLLCWKALAAFNAFTNANGDTGDR